MTDGSFPKLLGARTAGAFQIATNVAVGFHFRLQTGFVAHSQSCLEDGLDQSARVQREMRCHFVVSNDPGDGQM